MNLLFVERGSAILVIHLGKATTFGPRLGNGAVSVLILFVDKVDLRLEFFVRVGGNL